MANEKTNADIFQQFLNVQKEQSLTGNNNNFPTDYQEIKYLDLSENPSLFRLVGKPPVNGLDSRESTDSKEMFINRIKDDDGNIMYLILPLYASTATESHIIHRIVQDVMRKEYINKESVAVNKTKYPEIYKLVSKSGYDEFDANYKFATTWSGKRMLLINAIDRKDDWCAENKHTKIISKKIGRSTSADGKIMEFPERGVNSFGFLNVLVDLVTKDGNWENYDISCIKTSNKFNPYKLSNASKYCSPLAIESGFSSDSGLPEDLMARVKFGELTEDELNYERYDLDKIFHVTLYRTILKRLGKSIKKIDMALGRQYYSELVKLAEKEQQEFEERRKKAEEEAIENTQSIENGTDLSDIPLDTQEVEETQSSFIDDSNSMESSIEDMVFTSSVAEEAPISVPETMEMVPPQVTVATPPVTRRRMGVAVSNSSLHLSPEKIALLKGWDILEPAEKARIRDVELNADGTMKCLVLAPEEMVMPCDNESCGCYSPSDFAHCPKCGKSFV